MNNLEFLEKKESEKRNKLLRILAAKLPGVDPEELVKVILLLNLKRQYCIRTIDNFNYISRLATEEDIVIDEDVNGIEWQNTTRTKINVLAGNIKPGNYKRNNEDEEYVETKVLSGPSDLIIFIKEVHNSGFDLNRPDYENYLYLYKK